MGQPHEAGKREPGKMRPPMQHKTYYRTLNEGRRGGREPFGTHHQCPIIIIMLHLRPKHAPVSTALFFKGFWLSGWQIESLIESIP